MLEHDFQNFPELNNNQLSTLEHFSPHPQIKDDFEGFCERVVDGDTIHLQTNFRDFKTVVRLININTPEMNEGGEEAKQWLKEEIEGEEVYIKLDKKRVGKYGRILGEVIANGINLNHMAIALGYARRFGDKQSMEIPNFDKKMRKAEKKWSRTI